MAESSPPTISLIPFRDNPSSEAARRTVEQIEASLKKFGCVCIPSSDLDTDDEDGVRLLLRCYDAWGRFFALPEASKMAYSEENAAKAGYGGSCYTPPGKEPRYKIGENQNVESFNCTESTECSHIPGGAKVHNNLLPRVLGFRDANDSLWKVLKGQVARPFWGVLEQMLGLPRDFLSLRSAETSSLNMSLLRTLRYPARESPQQSVDPQTEHNPKRRRSTRNRVPSAPVEVGISEHTDFEVFSIMHQDTAGLHIHTPSRGPSPHWFQLPSRFDTLTIILGDMTELWSSGWLEATRHKVESPAYGQGPRRSMVLFQGHDDLVKVRPLGLADLAAREGGPESRVEAVQHTLGHQESSGEEGVGEQRSPGSDSFAEWVQHRPKNARKKYRPTTQGAWIRKQEGVAKASLLAA